VISGSSASAIIALNGADFVTIDGSNGCWQQARFVRVFSQQET
jgi:hypothetical protein